MGDQKGLTPGRGVGQKVAGMMPGPIVEIIKDLDPTFLTDWKSWQGRGLL